MKLLISIIFALWSLLIVGLYFFENTIITKTGDIFIKPIPDSISGSNFNIFIGYVIIISILYGIYKFIMISKKKEGWTILGILGMFLIQLLVLSFFYINIIKSHGGIETSSLSLFFHIISLLIYPIFLVLLWRSTGKSLLFNWRYWNKIPVSIAIIIETALGFGIMALLLGIAGKIGQYTSVSLAVIIILLCVLSFHGWKDTIKKIFYGKIDNPHPQLSSYTISAELSFIVFSLIAGTSLISILRPMPIGWDDLGVYMNFPKIIATTGLLLEGSGMYTWQLITGTGFLLNYNATQAFFINQIGGFLATIAIISSIAFFITKNKKQKVSPILCLPMLLGIIYYILPMTIFQQAKDMKLDPMLMFMSIASFLVITLAIRYFIQHFFQKEKTDNQEIEEIKAMEEVKTEESAIYSNYQKNFYILMIIAGILSGIAFGIKLTSLILILSLTGLIHYSLLGIFGFFGFIGLFIAIFTKLGLWSHMFVHIDPKYTGIIVFIFLFVGALGCIYSFFKNKIKYNILHFLGGISIFSFGILISVAPWILHNFSSLPSNQISISGLLNGDGTSKENGIFFSDYTKLYSKKELEKREKENNFHTISMDGTSDNEDFGRYFGQEKGLNNYIKLPINLTLQKNQGGEFTNITFIFLALVPVVLLLFGSKNPYIWISGIIFFLILGLISLVHTIPYPFLTPISQEITHILSYISLPIGYGILLLLVFGFIIFAHTLQKKGNEELTGILIFAGFYGLLFWISAFGIVWYGIMIYFVFLLIIALGIEKINNFQKSNIELIPLGIFLFITGIYIFILAPIHSISNLKQAGYQEYQQNIIPQNTAIFIYKPDYFKGILTLNIKNNEPLKKELLEKINNSPSLQKLFQEYEKNYKNINIFEIHNWLSHSLITSIQHSSSREYQLLKQEILSILEPFYQKVLYPTPEIENTDGIYRIGTFFTYFIHKNRSRYYEDSLIQNFQTYFYDESAEKTLENMKKLGLKYILIDLNAATIDNGEFKLTKRYEALLKTLLAKNAKLIDTDSQCLRIALDEYNNNNISKKEYLQISGVNYINFFGENNIITHLSRENKTNICANQIIKMIQQEGLTIKNGVVQTKSGKTYPYSSNIFFELQQVKSNEEFEQKLIQLLGSSWFALFEIQ